MYTYVSPPNTFPTSCFHTSEHEHVRTEQKVETRSVNTQVHSVWILPFTYINFLDTGIIYIL